MKIIIAKNEKDFAEAAFNEFISAIKDNPHPVLGLATGSTPLPLYRKIIDDCANGGVSYKNAVSFNLDEYAGLSREHAQSYLNFMRANLFDHIDINLDNVNIPYGDAADLEAECRRYSEALNNVCVDVQILGIGSNGHIAFNEPGTPFDSLTHLVKLSDKTVSDNARFFSNRDEVPKFAVTTGIGEIMRAKKIILLATGVNKANAVFDTVNGEISENCPASVLRRHSDCVLVLDGDAASKL